MQNEITKKTVLLNKQGDLAEPGWARQSYYSYDRKMIKVPRNRIKEWDYYCILGPCYGLALTVADNGYLGFFAVTLFDFINEKEISGSVMTPFPMGKLNMPSSSMDGNVVIEEKDIKISFRHSDKCDERGLRKRLITLDYPGFDDGHGIQAELELCGVSADYDRMVIATPFCKRKHFYFNEKHNCLLARGWVKSAGIEYEFGGGLSSGFEDQAVQSGTEAWAVLDWGRGVWTYNNTWYWGSASGSVDGIPFGFNIGYGFGDISAATENMLFYNGRVHKLEDVKFNIPGELEGFERYMEPWTFTSSDGRFEMEFKPAIDRFSNAKFLLLQSRQHQVFGYFNGKAVLDDDSIIEVKDLLGFAEKVYNRW